MHILVGDLESNSSKKDYQKPDSSGARPDSVTFVSIGIEGVALDVATTRGGV